MASETVCSVPLHRTHNEPYTAERCAHCLRNSSQPRRRLWAGGKGRSGASALCGGSKNTRRHLALRLKRLAFKARIPDAPQESAVHPFPSSPATTARTLTGV
jgi:hypothetical protein